MERAKSSEIKAYSQDDMTRLLALSGAVTASQQFTEILDQQGQDWMMIHYGMDGEQPRQVLIDRKFVDTLNQVGFFLYQSLSSTKMHSEAKAVMNESGPQQRVPRKRLLEIDREYNLNGTKRTF